MTADDIQTSIIGRNRAARDVNEGSSVLDSDVENDSDNHDHEVYIYIHPYFTVHVEIHKM